MKKYSLIGEMVSVLWSSRNAIGKIIFLPLWIVSPFVLVICLLEYIEDRTAK